MTEKLKNPVTAKYLSFFCPGLGQIYCGKWLRGIGIFYLVLSTIPFLVGIWIWKWNIQDAMAIADLYNQRALLKTVEKT